MEMILRADEDLTQEELTQLKEVWRQSFEGADQGIAWSDEPAWTVLVKVDSRVVSCAGILSRLARVGDTPVWLGGVGGVATLPAFRRQGFARLAMERAAAFLRDELGVDFGLLICAPEMVAYYGRLGWQWVADSLVIDQPQGKIVLGATTLILPCRSQAWPPGTIDLCGYPW